MASAADAFVAHHAAFDEPWVEPLLADIPRPWICTCEGIDWPGIKPNPSLSALALAHGVPVWAAHRALTDCIYLAQVLERTPDLEALLLQGLEPRHLVAADLPFQRRQEAKDAGFRWNADARRWERRLRQEQIEALPFPTLPIAP
jgi:DNA polymerase-3 subunit epsilon